MPSLTNIKKYRKAINNSTRKVVSLHELSMLTNINENRILDDLVIFEPLLKMKDNFNYRSLIDDLIDFIAEANKSKEKKATKKKRIVKQKYENTLDYFDKNLVLIGGLINNAFVFDEEKLKELRKVVNKELKDIKEKKK